MNKTIILQLRRHLQVFVVFFAGVLLYACNDTYDKHYDADPDIVADKNLWETLESVSELSSFTEVLKKYGYDQILSQSQAYTIFAPDNQAMAALDTSDMDVQKELIENHVARYFIPASGTKVRTIATLNEKRIKLTNTGQSYVFGAAPFTVPTKSVVASNGIVHVLSQCDPFFPNIREYMDKRAGLDSIGDYLRLYDEEIFVPEASVPGSIVDGQQTYLDSVFINYNEILYSFGHINKEDSSYTMIVPNNNAWTEAYERIKHYYVYYDANQETADSLQRVYATRALVQDLFFNNNLQESTKDSLVSTSENTFYDPVALFAGMEAVETSNGTAYIANQLTIKDTASWHQEIITEAEYTWGRENTLSTPFTVRVAGSVAILSNEMYLQLTPTTSSGNPTATFSVLGTLSSVYDIYCVFVTGLLTRPNAAGLRANKVYFNLNYTDEKGNYVTDRFPESGTIETDPLVMDTVLVASDFKFPAAFYKPTYETDEKASVNLKVFSNVARTETTLYSRELLIDCILLVPKSQD